MLNLAAWKRTIQGGRSPNPPLGSPLPIRKIGNELMGDGRQISNIMKTIHLTRTPAGKARKISEASYGCIDTGGQLS